MTNQETATNYWGSFPANLKSWMQPFEMFQKAGNNPFLVYAKSFEVMFTPNPQMQKQMTEGFSKMWNPIPLANMFALPNAAENKSDSTGSESAKNLNEMWQNPWLPFGTDLFKMYAEFFQKMTDLWMNAWKN